MVRRVRLGSISSELLICGGGVCSILLLPVVSICVSHLEIAEFPDSGDTSTLQG